MNILIKLMSIVSLVIAPSLAQINLNRAPEIGSNTPVEQPAIQGTFRTGPGGDAPTATGGTDLNADEEYRTLIMKLEQDGLFTIENNSISVANGQVLIDGKPLPPDVAAKYDYLVKEITRVQRSLPAGKK